MKNTFLFTAIFALSMMFVVPAQAGAEEKNQIPDLFYIQFDFWSGFYATQDGTGYRYTYQSKEFDEIFLNNAMSKKLIQDSYFNRGVGTALIISSVVAPMAILIFTSTHAGNDRQYYSNGLLAAGGAMIAAVFAGEFFIQTSYNQMFKGINEYNKTLLGEKHSGIDGTLTLSLNYKFE